MRQPRIFIASAVESLDVANAFNVNLDHQTEVTVWKDGFGISQNSIDSLVKMAESVDFAIFIFTPDDISKIRTKEKNVVRDNVIFELGLFIGTLGKDRCFIVKPRDKVLHLPTDLLGLTPADYNEERSDGNIVAAVNPSCTLIKNEIVKQGLISQDLNIQKKSRRKIRYDYKFDAIEYQLLARLLQSYTNSPEGISSFQIYDDLKDTEKGVLSLALVKLEQAGFIDKKIAIDHHYNDNEYYAFTITEEGIEFLLKNEKSVHKSLKIALNSKLNSSDDDIPF